MLDECKSLNKETVLKQGNSYPLSLQQKSILKKNYNLMYKGFLQLDNYLDINKLKNNLEVLINKYSIFNNKILMNNNIYYNVIIPQTRNVQIKIIKEKKIPELKNKILLEKDEFVDVDLFEFIIYSSESSNYLFYSLSKLIFDENSLRILLDKLNFIFANKYADNEDCTYFDYVNDIQNDYKTEKINYGRKMINDLLSDNIVNSSILVKKIVKNGYNQHDVLSGSFKSIDSNDVNMFCEYNKISKETFFEVAFSICNGIYSNNFDSICSYLYDGRDSNMYINTIGQFSKVNNLRVTFRENDTVKDILQKNEKIIKDIRSSGASDIQINEIMFKYSGCLRDNLNINDIPFELENLPSYSESFLFNVYFANNSFNYESSFWNNRYDKELVEIFIEIYENVLYNMMQEKYIQNVIKCLPDNLFPNRFFLCVSEIDDIILKKHVEKLSEENYIEVFVVDKFGRKQPFGAWGFLYFSHSQGENKIINSSRIARICPNGKLDFEDTNEKSILLETDNNFETIYVGKIKEALLEYNGISDVDIYVKYKKFNYISVIVDIKCSKNITELELEEYLSRKQIVNIYKITYYIQKDVLT